MTQKSMIEYLSKENILKLWKLILIPVYVLVALHFVKDITQDILQIPTILDWLGNVNEDLSRLPETLVWFYHWAMVNTFFVELFLLIAIPKCWRSKRSSKLDLVILISLFYLLAMFSLATLLDPKYQWIFLGSNLQKNTQKIKTEKVDKKISILSYNVLGGVYSQRILDELNHKIIKPDIACFQEFPENSNLSSQFENYFGPDYLSEKSLSIVFPKRKFGLATFYNREKFKLLNSKILHLPSPNWNIWEKLFTLSVKDGLSGPYDRTALINVFEHDGISLTLVNTHLGWEGGLNNQIRQLNQILNALKQSSINNNIVLCGDFNVGAQSKTSRPFFERLEQVGFLDLTDNIAYSVNLSSSFSSPEDKTKIVKSSLKIMVKVLGHFGVNTKQKIDYIFAKDLKKSFSEVYEIEGSDHYPIFVDLVL